MLEITTPSTLFSKQKLFKTAGSVENKTSNAKTQEVILVYSFNGAENLPAEEHAQLVKILTACKLKEEEVAFINASFTKNVSLAWLRNNYPVRSVIIFGDIEVGKNLGLKKYNAYHIDGIYLVKSEPVTKLMKNAGDKKALWEELKKVFGVA